MLDLATDMIATVIVLCKSPLQSALHCWVSRLSLTGSKFEWRVPGSQSSRNQLQATPSNYGPLAKCSSRVAASVVARRISTPTTAASHRGSGSCSHAEELCASLR